MGKSGILCCLLGCILPCIPSLLLRGEARERWGIEVSICRGQLILPVIPSLLLRGEARERWGIEVRVLYTVGVSSSAAYALGHAAIVSLIVKRLSKNVLGRQRQCDKL